VRRLFALAQATLLATQRVWLAAAAVALVGLGAHAACEPVAAAIIHALQRLGVDGANRAARGLTVTWEIGADLVLLGAALRVRDRAPNGTFAATLTLDMKQCVQLVSRLRRRWLFWLRPFALVCFTLAGAVSVGRLVGGQAFAALHGASDLFARIMSRSLAFALPLFVLSVLLLPLAREALFLALTRTNRAVHFRGRAYPRELLLALPVLPLAVVAVHEAVRWARW